MRKIEIYQSYNDLIQQNIMLDAKIYIYISKANGLKAEELHPLRTLQTTFSSNVILSV